MFRKLITNCLIIITLLSTSLDQVCSTFADTDTAQSIQNINDPLTRNSSKDFNIRSFRKNYVGSKNINGITPKSSDLVIKSQSGDSAVIQWNSMMDVPHSVFSYGSTLTTESRDSVVTIAKQFIRNNSKIFKINNDQLEQSRVATLVEDKKTGFTKLLLEQQVSGIRIKDTEMMFVTDQKGRLLLQAGSFIPGIEKLSLAINPNLSVETALNRAAEECGKKLTVPVKIIPNSKTGRTSFSSTEIDAKSNASLIYFPINQKEIRLAYEVLLYSVPTFIDAYRVIIDATNGELLERTYLTQALTTPSGRVFTKENPIISGDRELILFNGDPEASKAGWVSNDKLEGNNTIVVSAPNHNNMFVPPSPSDGEIFKIGEDGNFDFPIDLNDQPINSAKASATNLFYWVNLVHDKFYQLGFDEVSRNFQNDNFGRGGKDKDPVQAYSLLGATGDQLRNNAFFIPTLDGEASILAMLMFERNNDGKITKLDSCYDAGVIIHEYTHGVSNRIISSDSEFGLYSPQARGLGEGWSDFFAISFLSDEKTSLDASVPAGTYLTNPTRGIRSFPYSTSFDINPLTFGDIKYDGESHSEGTVWCTILWNIRQAFIKQYGFEKGREQVERLVINGLKMTPMVPTFIDARDAILAADKATNNGANQKLLWDEFAKRGLGASAITRDSDFFDPIRLPTGFLVDAVEGFDVPVEFSTGTLVINEKVPHIAVLDENLPLIIVDKDLLDLQSLNVKVTNQRTQEADVITLQQTAPGRFIGDLKITQDLTRSELTNKPGDMLEISYQDPKSQITTVSPATVGQRIDINKQDFDSLKKGQKDLSLFIYRGAEKSNYWHITEQRSVSTNQSLCFSKQGKNYVPAKGIGGVLFSLETKKLLKPQLEFDYFFDGVSQQSSDWLTVVSQSKNIPLFIFYNLASSSNGKFSKAAIDMRLLEREQDITLNFMYEASGHKNDRKNIEGAYIDNVRMTGVITD